MYETIAGSGADAGKEARIGDVTIPPHAPAWLMEAAFLRSLAPKHILFLCVANSARSQLAEGVARALAPAGVRVSSAGSEPTEVRPLAIEALAEIDIDIRDHRSKGMESVIRPVDAVITLCEEEVCPVWLDDAWRIHWGLPDPAAVSGSPDQQRAAFRSVRDELRRRLGVLLAGSVAFPA
jgi:arsenate reductase